MEEKKIVKQKHERIRRSLYMHEPIMHYDRMTLLKKVIILRFTVSPSHFLNHFLDAASPAGFLAQKRQAVTGQHTD